MVAGGGRGGSRGRGDWRPRRVVGKLRDALGVFGSRSEVGRGPVGRSEAWESGSGANAVVI